MNVVRHLILLLIASLIGSIFIKEPLPPELANFVIACMATYFIHKNLVEELKGEEDERTSKSKKGIDNRADESGFIKK